MFDIGFWELIVIAIVALLAVGPERLPGFAREAGKWAGRIRRFMHDARFELERELRVTETSDLEKNIAKLDEMIESAPDQQPGFKPAPLPGAGDKSAPRQDNHQHGDGN
jgi:sec-independent protein translocase protein TatB